MAGTDGRNALALTDGEIATLLDEGRRAQVGTLNADGSIHLVPLSYFVRDGRVALWTDPASRKIHNLRRDPRVTCLVELGERFEEFRAVQIRGSAEIVEGYEANREAGEALFLRARPEGLNDELRGYAAMLAAQRVTVVVHPESVVSWDHRKMAGVRPDEIGS